MDRTGHPAPAGAAAPRRARSRNAARDGAAAIQTAAPADTAAGHTALIAGPRQERRRHPGARDTAAANAADHRRRGRRVEPFGGTRRIACELSALPGVAVSRRAPRCDALVELIGAGPFDQGFVD